MKRKLTDPGLPAAQPAGMAAQAAEQAPLSAAAAADVPLAPADAASEAGPTAPAAAADPAALRRAGLAGLQGAAETLLLLPLLLPLAVLALRAPAGWLWLLSLPLLYAAGAVAVLCLPLHRRLPRSAVMALLAALQAWACCGTGLAALIALPGSWLAASRGARMTAADWNTLFPPAAWVFGLTGYAVLSVILPNTVSLSPYSMLLLVCGTAALVLTLFRVNSVQLRQEAQRRTQTAGPAAAAALPPALLQPNRLWTAGLLLLVLAAASASALWALLAEARQAALAWLLSLLGPPEEPTVQPERPPPAAAPPPDLGPPGEPAPWLLWLELAVRWLVTALLCAGALYLLYRLARLIPGWLRRAAAWLAARLSTDSPAAGEAAYTDEVESLTDWKLPLLPRRRRAGTTAPGPGWSELSDNRQRIRFLYRRWLLGQIRRGYVFRPHLTPSETITEAASAAPEDGSPEAELLRLYNAARYGRQPVTDEEAEALRRRL